jgi:hypothetical protein
VLSGYGTHLVYVHDHQKPEPPVFVDVEAQVRQEWESDKRAELNMQFIDSMIARYEVIIEDGAVTQEAKDVKEQIQ